MAPSTFEFTEDQRARRAALQRLPTGATRTRAAPAPALPAADQSAPRALRDALPDPIPLRATFGVRPRLARLACPRPRPASPTPTTPPRGRVSRQFPQSPRRPGLSVRPGLRSEEH